MAAVTSGSINVRPDSSTLSDVPRRIYLDWYIVEVDYALRRTKIHYRAYLENSGGHAVKSKCTAVVNGVTVCSVTNWTSYYPANHTFAENDMWIQHNDQGEASFSVRLTGNIGHSDRSASANATYQLPHVDQGIVYIDNGSSIDKYQAYVDNGTGWDLCIPYTDNGTGWDIMA